jgi:hypothetical protein
MPCSRREPFYPFQEDVRAPLQPVERVNPPFEYAARPRPVLDPELGTRFPRRCVVAARPDRVPGTQRRFRLGDEGDARREVAVSKAFIEPGDGG